MTFRRRLLFNLFKLTDVCIFVVSMFIAVWFVTYGQSELSLSGFLSMRIRIVNLLGFSAMLLMWQFLLNGFQLYRSRRLENRFQECKDIFKATSLGAVVFLLVGFTFRISAFTPLFILVFWLSSMSLTILFRVFLRYMLGIVRRYGRNLRFILIVGTNERAYEFARMLEQKREMGYRLLGYIDKNIHMPNGKLELLGTLEDFPSIMNSHVIDEIVIALPIKSNYEEISKIIYKAEEHGITVRQISQLFNTKIAHSKAEVVEDFSFLTMVSGPQDGWQYFAKRAMDFTVASALIILTSPIMLLATIAIKLGSSGPVFFIQKRVGYNKRVFKLYKFRTMTSNAENIQGELEGLNEMDGPVFKIERDPRITRVGRWLRKWSIDELPQLFNVMKGDMSLVGPRPLPVRDYSGFRKDWHRRRFSTIPGITCTWQINGRNTISFEEWMKMDMEYIDNWKLATDFSILLKTIPAVFRAKGAA